MILIADDEEINREILKAIFEEEYRILEVSDGAQAIEAIEHYNEEIVLVLLDLRMPRKSGLDVLDYMVDRYMKWIPVIMITGEATDDTDFKAYEYGVSDIIYKPFASRIVKRRAMNVIELFEQRIDIENQLQERTKELIASKEKLEKSNEFLINALSSVVEFRSVESGDHIHRVKYFTQILLKYLKNHYPEYNLQDEQVALIENASALHDLGKIAIPDNILLKPGKLTKEEYEEMKKHTIYGSEMLERFKQEDTEFYRYCYDICRYHHERYDGSGYPDQLVGEEIPIWAQIVSIVDVFDALVSKRVYKAAFTTENAVKMICTGECGQFSPKIVDCFLKAKEELFHAVANSDLFDDVAKREVV